MKFFSKLNRSYYSILAKASVALGSLFAPLLALAANGDAPTDSPWKVGLTFNDGNMVNDTAMMVKKALTYAGIFVGALLLIGGTVYIWQSVNMPREEKEHHNIPLRIIMGVLGVIVGLGLVLFLVHGLGTLT